MEYLRIMVTFVEVDCCRRLPGSRPDEGNKCLDLPSFRSSLHFKNPSLHFFFTGCGQLISVNHKTVAIPMHHCRVLVVLKNSHPQPIWNIKINLAIQLLISLCEKLASIQWVQYNGYEVFSAERSIVHSSRANPRSRTSAKRIRRDWSQLTSLKNDFLPQGISCFYQWWDSLINLSQVNQEV